MFKFEYLNFGQRLHWFAIGLNFKHSNPTTRINRSYFRLLAVSISHVDYFFFG